MLSIRILDSFGFGILLKMWQKGYIVYFQRKNPEYHPIWTIFGRLYQIRGADEGGTDAANVD